MMACGEEEKDKGEFIITDPGNIEVARVDIHVVYAFDAIAEVNMTFDSLLPMGNLMHYGWIGIVAISEVDFPETCDAASYRDFTSYVQIKDLLPGKYFVRACAANGATGYISKGITKEFIVNKNLQQWYRYEIIKEKSLGGTQGMAKEKEKAKGKPKVKAKACKK